ncbi:MAG: MarR family transcriptional regulator [Planctomycetia bacterium]|nr:MarR family transcriptional regulator [Planctomycetia bacterium]
MNRAACSDAEPVAGLKDEFPHSAARAAVVAIVRGYGAVQRQMEPYFAQFGLTPPQFQVLTIINRLRGRQPTQRQLALELYVSFPNVTVMLGRLEQAGLVRRRNNPKDRREKFVELTHRGRALLQRIWQVHQVQLDSVMAGLSDAEQFKLTRLLDKMIAGATGLATRDRPVS